MHSVKTVRDFMDLYNTYYPKIYNFFYRDVLHRETAEDLTSGTFMKALRFIKTKNREIKNFNAWIYKIATNELFSHLNYKRKRKIHIAEGVDDKFISSIKDDREKKYDFSDFMLVKEAVDKLKTGEKLLVEMHFFEKLEYSEMSAILKMKETTIRSKIHRALKKLAVLIKKEIS